MSLKSLTASGTKLWLDSVDPDEVKANFDLGATGATSNPAIISKLIGTGRFDKQMEGLFEQMGTDPVVCWAMTDLLVSKAQVVFQPVWEKSGCNDGWVSFELDPLLEDPAANVPVEKATKTYTALAEYWSGGYTNRLIKIPATEAGLGALEEVVAAGVSVNVTLCFTERQYKAAREAVWKGVQRMKRDHPAKAERFKSVYSIFVSRVDVYTEEHVPGLSDAAQGMVGIVNAKRLWQMNQEYWKDKGLKLQQEIVFASTGKKLDWQSEDYYVEALAGSDIQTNPPETNDAVQANDKHYSMQLDKLPPQSVLDEIDQKVDVPAMEEVLMREGVEKFAKPMKKLIATVKDKRGSMKSA